MHGRLERSRKAKWNVEDIARSNMELSSTINVEINQQKIWNLKIDKTCKNVYQITEKVGAFELHTWSDQNQYGVINSLRSEIDQKIDKASKTYPDVSALIQEVITLRCFTNALLKDRLA